MFAVTIPMTWHFIWNGIVYQCEKIRIFPVVKKKYYSLFKWRLFKFEVYTNFPHKNLICLIKKNRNWVENVWLIYVEHIYIHLRKKKVSWLTYLRILVIEFVVAVEYIWYCYTYYKLLFITLFVMSSHFT